MSLRAAAVAALAALISACAVGPTTCALKSSCPEYRQSPVRGSRRNLGRAAARQVVGALQDPQLNALAERIDGGIKRCAKPRRGMHKRRRCCARRRRSACLGWRKRRGRGAATYSGSAGAVSDFDRGRCLLGA
jgi:hypothetical protein